MQFAIVRDSSLPPSPSQVKLQQGITLPTRQFDLTPVLFEFLSVANGPVRIGFDSGWVGQGNGFAREDLARVQEVEIGLVAHYKKFVGGIRRIEVWGGKVFISEP